MENIKIIKISTLITVMYFIGAYIGLKIYDMLNIEGIVLIWILIALLSSSLSILIRHLFFKDVLDKVILVSLVIGMIVVILGSIIFSISTKKNELIPDITLLIFIPGYILNSIIISGQLVISKTIGKTKA